MALIKCPECGRCVSDTLEHCVHCGYPLKKLLNKRIESSQNKTQNGDEVILRRNRKAKFTDVQWCIYIVFAIWWLGVSTTFFYKFANEHYDNWKIIYLLLAIAHFLFLVTLIIAWIVTAVRISRNNDCGKQILIRRNGVFIAYDPKMEAHRIKSLDAIRYKKGVVSLTGQSDWIGFLGYCVPDDIMNLEKFG